MTIDRLGFYQVGEQKIYHKPMALMAHSKTGQPISWVFNDEVFGAIDWSIPVEDSLDELYRQRAQQLRDHYDHLTLYFSGGADSSNMLRAFVTNNIFLDEIVMQSPSPVKRTFNDRDRSSRNVYSEIPYSAVPILNELKNLIDSRTVIRYQDTSVGIIELLKNDNWYEYNPPGVALGINPLARQYTALTEKHILKLSDQGKKIAQIVGVDKPLLHFDGQYYYAFFLDTNALHCPPVELNIRERFETSLHTEFFYWTPDLPRLVIKQAQEIKRACELDPRLRQIVCVEKNSVGQLRSVLHPIIYPSMPEVPFQADKDGQGTVRAKDLWFRYSAGKLQQNNFDSYMKFLESAIEPRFFINHSIANGFTLHKSRLYPL